MIANIGPRKVWRYRYRGMILFGEMYFAKPASRDRALAKLREDNNGRLPPNTEMWRGEA